SSDCQRYQPWVYHRVGCKTLCDWRAGKQRGHWFFLRSDKPTWLHRSSESQRSVEEFSPSIGWGERSDRDEQPGRQTGSARGWNRRGDWQRRVWSTDGCDWIRCDGAMY